MPIYDVISVKYLIYKTWQYIMSYLQNISVLRHAMYDVISGKYISVTSQANVWCPMHTISHFQNLSECDVISVKYISSKTYQCVMSYLWNMSQWQEMPVCNVIFVKYQLVQEKDISSASSELYRMWNAAKEFEEFFFFFT